MECIFKKVKVIDPESKFNLKICDVHIKDGIILDIKSEIRTTKKIKTLSQDGSFLSRGWIDVGTLGGDPGNEHRETLESMSAAAISGGYTTLCIFPNTQPALHSKSEVNYIITKSAGLAVHFLPIGAISKNCKSEEMAEMLQMYQTGAIAFSDGKMPIQSSSLMIKAMEYVKLIPNGLIINQSLDKGISGQGQVNEGHISTLMGLKGIPKLSETVSLHRDIALLEYTGSSLLVHKVSCEDSVKVLKTARKKLKNLYASVSIFNLIFEESSLLSFNKHLKLNPPIRSERDRQGLINALKEGTIDLIVSDHTPWDPEYKELEFQSSSFGSISLETCFAAFCSFLLKDLSLELWIQKTVLNPVKILGLKSNPINIGQACDLCWFDPKMPWKYSEHKIKSLSKNSPFVHQDLKGKVLGTYSKNKLNINL